MQSPSSSATADTVSRLTSTEAGRDEPSTSRKRKRKRSMAGRQIEQTTTGTGAFPPHQQQPESGTIPPIKLRRVTGNNSCIERSSSTSVQGNPEPMETDSAMPADAASTLPGIAINLPTDSDNRPLTGNEHTSEMVQDMPVPMEDVPLTTEINSETAISEFSESQQNELRIHLNNQEIQAVLKNAGILLKTLNDRKIQLARDRGKPPAHSLFSKLKNFSIVKDSQTFKGYFAKANTFFLAVNTQQITNTSCLTSMLKSKIQIKAFAEAPEENIQSVADNPCLKQIASMCNSKGLPKDQDVKAFLMLPCLKVGWQEGKHEDVKGKPLDRALVTNISSMCNGKGLPKDQDVKAFLTLPCLKVGWQEGKHEDVKGKPLDRALVTNISSMCHGKGLPKDQDVKAFLTLPCLK
ncbi:hypothetical protein, partial [Salinisphaera sp. G21_0]|uniref:hypothetical protein n=1 Tax=Salinisphaera sp. G21_0 TaxID=2821094 RepID=UPI001ADCD2CA